MVRCKALRDPARKSLAWTVERGVEPTLGYMEKRGAEEGSPVASDLRAITRPPKRGRSGRGLGRLRAAVAALAFLGCLPALAQNAPAAPADEPAAVVERARAMIFDGRPAAALELLRPLAERYPNDTDAHFFRGMAASAAANLPEGRPGAPETDEARRALRDEAVASYRHILESRPGLAGARLELARVLFERGRCTAPPESLLEHLLGDDCDAAAHHFRRALAGGLPEAVAGAVSQFLAAVQARKRVSGQFGLAIAPDSNVNAGTSAHTFPSRIRNFYTGESLEFELDEQARETSGIGAVISASGEYRHPFDFRVAERSATRLLLGGSFYRREYGGRRFDDMILAAYAGPQLLFPRGRASLLGKAERRWSAGKPVSRGVGPRLGGGLRLGERVWLGGGIERIERRHRYGPLSDGPRTDVDLDLIFSATPAATVGMRGGWQRARAEEPSLRSRTRRIGGFAAADLPPVFGVSGFHAALFHDVLFTGYDEPGYRLITADAREDRTSITRLSASNDHIELFGFVPELSLVHERRESNVAEVFDYRRNRAEITIRRRF